MNTREPRLYNPHAVPARPRFEGVHASLETQCRIFTHTPSATRRQSRRSYTPVGGCSHTLTLACQPSKNRMTSESEHLQIHVDGHPLAEYTESAPAQSPPESARQYIEGWKARRRRTEREVDDDVVRPEVCREVTVRAWVVSDRRALGS